MRTSNVMENKNKKKTLTISSSLKKKIDTSAISTGNRKSFSVQKKNRLKQIKILINQTNPLINKVHLNQQKKILLEDL